MKTELSKVSKFLFKLIVLHLTFLITPAFAETFNGFFTPDYVKGLQPPYVPVSVTGSLTIGNQLNGELKFRETGNYQANGTLNGRMVTLNLYGETGELNGHAKGTLERTKLSLQVWFQTNMAELRTKGSLAMEADVEWRASKLVKAGRQLRDKAGHYWYEASFDDQKWDLIHLPDDDSFGQKVYRSRLYRSHFWLNNPAESVNVVLSNTQAEISRQNSEEAEFYNLIFSSDDGIWIYVNGKFLGHWGAKEKRGKLRQ